MADYNQNETRTTPNPDALQADIEATRQRIDRTVASLERKMTPGQMVDEAVRFVGGGGASSINTESIVSRVSSNPAAAAMMALGAIWLLKSGSQPSGSTGSRFGIADALGRIGDSPRPASGNDSRVGDKFDDLARTATNKIGEWKDKAADAVGQLRSDDRSGARTTGVTGVHPGSNPGGSTAAGTVDRVKDAVSESADKLRDGTDRLRQVASEKTDQLRDAASETTDHAREALEDARRRASAGIEQISSQATRLVEEQPLVLAGLGLAVGAAIGALLPTSDKEREMLGQASGDLKARASEALDSVKQTAVNATQEAAGKIGEQVKTVAEQHLGDDDKSPGQSSQAGQGNQGGKPGQSASSARPAPAPSPAGQSGRAMPPA